MPIFSRDNFWKTIKKKREEKAELLLNSVLICSYHSSSLQLSPTIFLAPTGFRGTELRRIESPVTASNCDHIAAKRTRGAPLDRFSDRRAMSANCTISATIAILSFCSDVFFAKFASRRSSRLTSIAILAFLSDSDKSTYVLWYRETCDRFAFQNKNIIFKVNINVKLILFSQESKNFFFAHTN